MRPNGAAIRYIRRAQMLSLRSLSEQTGLDRGYLSRLERGHIRRAGDNNVLAIAAAMRVPLSAITHEEMT
ncbi:helix-turn-helix domain-containing protein [Streptomyces monomycini]|uniref:helix-turn-helix domain-containing protein n=1 Tax=Streptomyces monomycini TaxID=371720 RepID=UPI00244931EF|nr:helix-turn-helix transcriptional regulator [Streptomyces monomycini]